MGETSVDKAKLQTNMIGRDGTVSVSGRSSLGPDAVRPGPREAAIESIYYRGRSCKLAILHACLGNAAVAHGSLLPHFRQPYPATHSRKHSPRVGSRIKRKSKALWYVDTFDVDIQLVLSQKQ